MTRQLLMTLAISALAAVLFLASRPAQAAQPPSERPPAALENPGQPGVGVYDDRLGFCHRFWHRDTFWRWYPYGDLYMSDPSGRPYWNCQGP